MMLFVKSISEEKPGRKEYTEIHRIIYEEQIKILKSKKGAEYRKSWRRL